MNEPISLTYHQAQAVAERAARVRNLARQHKGYGVNERTRVVVFIGNPYYSEPDPELHGQYLKVEGGGTPVPLFAKDLGYERNFEVARLGMRDENGHVQHPDMDGIGWDEFDMGPQLRAIGWHTKTVSFESDASDEARARYDEGNSPDCSYWTPTPPQGDGWLLAAIYDTEDGPVALFVRTADSVATVDQTRPHWRCICGTVAMPLTDDTRCNCADTYDQQWSRVDPAAGVSVTGDQTFSAHTPMGGNQP